MKRKVLLALSLCFTLAMLNISAQVKPSPVNLKHLWDFETGDVKDKVGDADGILYKDAEIGGGKLKLLGTDAQAGYVELFADVIQINTFPEITLEIWATANAVEINNPNMLVYFGTTQGTLGYDYLLYTPSRRFAGDPETRVGVSTGTWNAEDGITYMSLGDEQLHHHVVTWKDSLVILYVDGDSVGSSTPDSADTQNWYHIGTTLSNDSAFIGKGGYSSDPTWKGTVDLMSLWDKALSPDEIQWLFEAGEKRGPIVADGIDAVTALQSVKIYSLNNRLFIKNVPDYLTTISVTLYNITGSIVYQNNDFQNGAYLSMKQGVYIVKVESQEANFVQKVVIK